MECPTCHRSITDDANLFCIQCGGPLSDPSRESSASHESFTFIPSPCASCHYHNAPAARFCTHCGLPLTKERFPMLTGDAVPNLEMEDERRTVTVLHVDICGFTRLTEQLGPEHTKTIIDALFHDFEREVLSRGGRIDAYIGDAVLAVFGVPISHGDDPMRATNAALTLHQITENFRHPLLPTGIHLQVRAGVDTGPVVVGRIGSIRRTTVTGATVTGAMEMERWATPGGTLISEATCSLLAADLLRTPAVVPYTLANGRLAFQLRGLHRGEAATSGTQPRLRAEDSVERDDAKTGATIDRLSMDERRVLKGASVAGTFFWQELLERMGLVDPGRLLQSLVEKGLIQSCIRPQIPGTTEYRFISSALRDVVYQTNLIRVRKFSHRVVASWLEERVDGQLDFGPLLAHHHAAGGDYLEASHVLVTAAQRLLELDAADEAVARYREALTYLETADTPSPEIDNRIRYCRDQLSALRGNR